LPSDPTTCQGTIAMNIRPRVIALLAPVLACLSPLAAGAPVTYELDPGHTFPSFEGDHMGISVWRGKFNRTTGTMTLDRDAGSGRVQATVDLSSVDFGHDGMNAAAVAEGFFDVARHPVATYAGELTDFEDGVPTRVRGELTLHGVTRPLDLKLPLFRCMAHPLHGRELCGADALARFDRSAFGLDAGREHGFDMTVTLRIQVEAVAVAEDTSADRTGKAGTEADPRANGRAQGTAGEADDDRAG
jgi:polyisoprenoid-binding protein YceI